MNRVSGLPGWLSCADAPRQADLIFVLAGRVHRKEYALELFRQGLAPGVLFSVGRYEIRRFSKMALPAPLDLLTQAQELPPPERHYFAFFKGKQVEVERVPPGRFGTLTEIDALARWLGLHTEIRSILIISSATHLRRIRLCRRFLLDPKLEIALLTSPASLPLSPGALDSSPQADAENPVGASAEEPATSSLLELFKLSAYWFLLKMR